MLRHASIPLLLTSTVIALMVAAAAVRYPRRWLLVVVFLLPFLPKWAGVQVMERMPVLNPLKATLMLVAVSWWLDRRGRGPSPGRPLATALFLLVGAEVVSIGSSVLAGTGSYVLGFTTVLGKVLYFYGLYVIVYDLVESRKDVDALVTVLAVAGVVCGIQAIVEVFLQWNPYNLLPRYDIDKGYVESIRSQMRLALPRAQGAFTQSISFGIYLGMVLPLACYRAGAARSTLGRAGWSAGAVVVALGEVLTLSRGAIGATLVVLAAVFVRSWRGALVVAIVGTAAIAAISTGTSTTAVAARTLVLGSIDPAVSDELSSSTFSRIEAVSMGIRDAERGMPFGLGPQYRSTAYLVSIYLTYLIRSGIPAFVAFL